MKTAIMSDAHANPFALETAIGDARAQKCERLVFLGDITGYGPDAIRTLELVRHNFDVAVVGNHDTISAGLDDREEMLQIPNYDLDFQQGKALGESDREWMRGLPRIHVEANQAYAHGDFRHEELFAYVNDRFAARSNLIHQDGRFLFVGHTHVPMVWFMDGYGDMHTVDINHFASDDPAGDEVVVQIQDDCRYFVNAGSVGYPRAVSRSTYVILEDDKAIRLRSLPFDYARYFRAFEEAGIPIPGWLQ